MITAWVGGVQKGQNLDYVMFDWSLIALILKIYRLSILRENRVGWVPSGLKMVPDHFVMCLIILLNGTVKNSSRVFKNRFIS